jgi:hypothetical protein
LNERTPSVNTSLFSQAELESILCEPLSHIELLAMELRYPAQYLVVDTIVKAVIIGFFRLMWSGEFSNRLDIVAIEGDRTYPQALLHVHGVEQCPTFFALGIRPLAVFIDRRAGIAVSHPDACAVFDQSIVSSMLAYAEPTESYPVGILLCCLVTFPCSWFKIP